MLVCSIIPFKYIGSTWYDSDDQLGWNVVNFYDSYRKGNPYQTGNIKWYEKWINLNQKENVIMVLWCQIKK